MINKSIKNRHRYRSCRGMMSYGGKRGGEIIKNSIEIIMPEIISLDDSNRDRLLSTLYTIHNFTKTHSFITINFSRTAKVFSDGMLLLYAELCNIKNIYPSTKLRCKPSKILKLITFLNK